MSPKPKKKGLQISYLFFWGRPEPLMDMRQATAGPPLAYPKFDPPLAWYTGRLPLQTRPFCYRKVSVWIWHFAKEIQFWIGTGISKIGLAFWISKYVRTLGVVKMGTMTTLLLQRPTKLLPLMIYALYVPTCWTIHLLHVACHYIYHSRVNFCWGEGSHFGN